MAPCSALIDNNMRMVRMNELPTDETLVRAMIKRVGKYYKTTDPPRMLHLEATRDSFRSKAYQFWDEHMKLSSVEPQITAIHDTATVKVAVYYEKRHGNP